ncbi:hypothetical protein D9M68_586730 [compost metagenome]
MPIRKVGSDTPTSDTAMTARLATLSRRIAVYTPSATPPATASTAATSASSSVAGSRSAMSSTTGRFSRYDTPRSPCSAWPT